MAQGFGSGDTGSLLKQAQEMQRRMQEAERALAERTVEGTAGGGVVRVVMTGKLEVQSVKIAPEAVDPKDVETLEDLVSAAMRQALTEALEMKDSAMQKITGGLDLPGLGF